MEAIILKITGTKDDLNNFIAFIEKHYLIVTRTRLLFNPEKSEANILHAYLTITSRIHALQRD